MTFLISYILQAVPALLTPFLNFLFAFKEKPISFKIKIYITRLPALAVQWWLAAETEQPPAE